MKSQIRKLFCIALLSLFIGCNVQIKNAVTDNVRIEGNCDICKSTIEKAGNKKKVAQVNWDKDTKIAVLTYDDKKTNKNEILKKIALAGYDNAEFLAPKEAYDNLLACCQYERTKMVVSKTKSMSMVGIDTKHDHPTAPTPEKDYSMAKHEMKTDSVSQTPIVYVADQKIKNSSQVVKDIVTANETKQIENQMSLVFDAYFALKNELVKTNRENARLKAKNLTSAIKAVKTESLKKEEMLIWQKVSKLLENDAQLIANTKDISDQRKKFISLSSNIYILSKVVKFDSPVYYQFCPMANDGKGANWLSKENEIKNPYYGAQMLTCGRTVETIK